MHKPLGRKQKAILALLADGQWVRGAEIARSIGVPGYILWPYIERLRDRGFEIEGDASGALSTGYRLVMRQRQAA